MFSSNGSQVASNAANYIEDVFSNYLYTGNGSTQTITNGIDLSGKGGLVWIKDRGVSYSHAIFDTARGAGSRLYSNLTNAQDPADNSLTAFTSSGFSVGVTNSGTNQSGDNYASWTFRKQPKFFDVVTWTGNGVAGRTIAHNLGSVPGCVIVKRVSAAYDWCVWHRGFNSGDGYGFLDVTNAFVIGGGPLWGNGTTYTAPTSSVFSVSSDPGVNASGSTYVAYIYAHNAGGFGLTGTDNVISCGSFTTDGSGNATVNLGYEPQWVMVKPVMTGSWYMVDSMRGNAALNGTSLTESLLFADLSNAEATNGYGIANPTATGFVAASWGASQTMLYIAIRRGPMKVPTDATKVFAPSTRTGTGSAASFTGAGFPVDFVGSGNRNTANGSTFFTRLQGAGKLLWPYGTNAEVTDNTSLTGFDSMTGFSVGADGSNAAINYPSNTYAYWNFRRAPSFFDEVCYTGTGVTHTETHTLGVVPELIIFKTRNNGSDWITYAAPLGATKRLLLNGVNAAATDSFPFANTAPTSTVFTVGTSGDTNASGLTYVAYLFASCPGVSKVGSYTGTGTAQTINCGFTAGARFVLIKRTDSTGDWYVWDTARGIVSGNDPYLLLNSTAAEVTSTDYISPQSSGFGITATAPAAINASGGTYIFLAIA